MQVNGNQQAEQEWVHIKDNQHGQEDRHKNNDDLTPFEWPTQDEDNQLRHDQELQRTQVERQNEVFDQTFATQIREDRRESPRTHK